MSSKLSLKTKITRLKWA